MRILLPFCTSIPPQTFYQEFHQGIAEALLDLGHEPVRYEHASLGEPLQKEAEELFRKLESGNFSAIFDIACFSYGLSGITLTMQDDTNATLYDAFGIPCFGMLWDHPFNQAINGIRATRLYATYPDREHGGLVRLAYPQLEIVRELFVPPAVRTPNDKSSREWASGRDIDVLYVGNLVPEALDRFWNDRASRAWNAHLDAPFCNALADIALQDSARAFHLDVESAIAAAGERSPGFDLCAQMRAVEHHLRFTYRRKAVAAVANSGVPVRLVGRGWDQTALPGNVEFSAETNYEGFLRQAGHAKICLDASTYLDGANDRVFSYAINRSVTFTNAAGYLRRGFGEDNGMRFYSMNKLSELDDEVKSLLAHPQELREAGERARQTVLSAHTWRHRLGDILGALNLARGIAGSLLPPPPAPGR